MDGETDLNVRMIRMEAKLDAITQAIEFGDRSSAQLVQLVSARLDRAEQDILATLRKKEEEHATFSRKLDDLDHRASAIENWKAKVAGIALGVATLAGGSAGAVVKLLSDGGN